MQLISIRKHQTNIDFALQHFGDLEGVFDMAMLNGLSITETPAPGTVLKTIVNNENVAGYFITKGLDVSGTEPPIPSDVLPGGIGFMKIINPALPQSNDFIVS
ncbi:MAG: hypothetical protein JSR97_12540 [Verrucomicrobia bacterium]|nr:hypothetical protein [Verrucomicrobiota bacterium]